MTLFQPMSSQFDDLTRPSVIATSLIGFFVVFYYVLRFSLELAKGIKLYCIAQLKCCQVNLVKRYGQWAVVTGATNGIGLAFAKELASRGMSVLLISRNSEKLAKTKAMLEGITNVGQVETVNIDMSNSSLENYERIREQIDPDNRDIGILINNLGVWPEGAQRFNRFSTEYLITMGNVNMLSLVHMTRMIMPGLLKRQKGLMVNVSSICSSYELPYMGIYMPTKSFMRSFTKQLHLEYADHPIDIVHLTTGPVLTREKKLGAVLRQIVVNPDDYARSALNASATGCPEFTGIIAHALLNQMIYFMSCTGILDLLIRNAPRLISSRSANLSP